MFPAPLLKDIPTGEWVALSADERRVVAHGRDLAEVIRAAERAGEPQAIITGVPEPNVMLAVWHDA
jgi:hypothetical protein